MKLPISTDAKLIMQLHIHYSILPNIENKGRKEEK